MGLYHQYVPLMCVCLCVYCASMSVYGSGYVLCKCVHVYMRLCIMYVSLYVHLYACKCLCTFLCGGMCAIVWVYIICGVCTQGTHYIFGSMPHQCCYEWAMLFSELSETENY